MKPLNDQDEFDDGEAYPCGGCKYAHTIQPLKYGPCRECGETGSKWEARDECTAR